MEEDKKIEIIKEILYEESTRKMLAQQQVTSNPLGTQTTSKPLWKWLAAASVIAILSFIGFNYMNASNVDTQALIAEVYEFPAINKSRGAEINVVDSYIHQINNGKYESVLSELSKSDLTEKDLFYKASMLFSTGKYDAASKILVNTNWNDNYYREESNWLQFLIAFERNEKSAVKLKSNLNSTYLQKAETLLDKRSN